MSIFEFNEEREMKLIRADEREIGRMEGRDEAIHTSASLLIKYDLNNNIAEDIIIQKVVDIFGLEQDEAEQIFQAVSTYGP